MLGLGRHCLGVLGGESAVQRGSGETGEDRARDEGGECIQLMETGEGLPGVMAWVVERGRPADEELELAARGSNAAVHEMVDKKHVVAMDVIFGGDSGRGGDDASGKLTRVSIMPG